MTAQLDQWASVTLNGSGNGTVRVGPGTLSQLWHVTTAAVTGSSTTHIPTATLYLNGSTVSSRGGTYDGSNDSTDLAVDLVRGQYLTCIFAGGDPGALHTLSLSGTYEVA